MADSFKLIRRKYSQAAISLLKDKYDRIFTNRHDQDRICYDFYGDWYRHREVSEVTLRKVFEGFSAIFMNSMNVSLTKCITKK